MVQVTPFGACGTVTGSCHLVEFGDTRILLDCGMYQGEAEDQNEEPFGFDPATIDLVVLTHAHLDHIGRLPRLVHEGFRGPVLATAATHTLVEPMLEDALGIMTEDHRRRQRHGEDPGPLPWDENDLEVLAELAEPLAHYQQREVGTGRVELLNAGHLPGSAFVQVEADGRRLVYSGDLGNRRKEVLPDPDYATPADLVLTEATYGDRNHRPLQQTVEEFADLLADVLGRGGRAIIPSFALERTQELLFYLRELEADRRIPLAPVYLDSPLAIEITRLYDGLRDTFGLQVRTLYDQGIDPFRPHQLTFTRSSSDSRRLNDLSGPATIIAGSGMFSGGRILHHLLHHLDDDRTVLRQALVDRGQPAVLAHFGEPLTVG